MEKAMSGDANDIEKQVARLAEYLRARHEWLTVAESCTGGWLAKVCTDLAGSSGWFERGFVTYSNAAKQDMLGVPAKILKQTGAVSEATVRAMATGALQRSSANWSVSISGIAGPGGGSDDKPVGTVWFGWAGPDGWQQTATFVFSGNRQQVRAQSVACALQGLLDRLESL